jgi:general stress protein 26
VKEDVPMDATQDRDTSIARLREMIKDIGIAMFTTATRDGALHSRPMATQQVEFDGTLWFFTRQDTAKTEEIAEHRRVNIAYSNADAQRYVSMSGVATIVRDRAKAAQLWSPAYRTWFPDGLEDPEMILLRVDVEQAEYWDAGASRMTALAGFAKSLPTGRPFSAGEHEKMTLDPSGN